MSCNDNILNTEIQQAYDRCLALGDFSGFMPDSMLNPTTVDFSSLLESKKKLETMGDFLLGFLENLDMNLFKKLEHKDITVRAKAIADIHLLYGTLELKLRKIGEYRGYTDKLYREIESHLSKVQCEHKDLEAYHQFLDERTNKASPEWQQAHLGNLKLALVSCGLGYEQLQLAQAGLMRNWNLLGRCLVAFRQFQGLLNQFIATETIDTLMPVEQFLKEHNFVEN